MRARTVDLMLLGTVLLWALNATVTRYVLTHGFHPLAYATIRYALAAGLFWVFTWTRERSFRIAARDLRYIAIAASMIFVNQLSFVYSVDKTSAATVTLFLGTTPIFIGVVASVIGLERMGRGFWFATAVSLVGVAFVASGSGGFSGHVFGDGLAVSTALTWAMYSVSITPLMRRYSPYRISGLVLLPMTAVLLLMSVGALGDQDYGRLPALDWLGLAYAVVGPLVLTNVLWFTAIRRVGPSRATLFANAQPFLAVSRD